MQRSCLGIEALEDRRLLARNGTIAEATPLDFSIEGEIQVQQQIEPAGDVDLYRVELAAEQQFIAELLDGNVFLRFFDSHGELLTANEEDGVFLSHQASVDGPIFIGVSGVDNVLYDPTNLLDRNGFVTSNYGFSASISASSEIPRNNSLELAIPIELDTTVDAHLKDTKDVDFFSFHLEHSGKVDFLLTATSANLRLDLLDANGQIIRSDAFDHLNHPTSWIGQHLSAGDYFLRVSSGNDFGPYKLNTSFGPAILPFQPIGISDLSGYVDVAQLNDDNLDGEINESDFLDLVSVAINAGTINTMFGLGDGSFGLPVTTRLALPSTTDSVVRHELSDAAIADFNGDTIPDIALTVKAFRDVNGTEIDTTGLIAVLLGNSMGRFQSALDRIFKTGILPAGIVTADVNDDGHTDVTVVNSKSNNIQIWRGNSTGKLILQQTLPTEISPVALAITDLNHDGKSDFAVANFQSNSVSTLIQSTAGVFQTAHYPLNMPGMSEIVGPDAISTGQLTDDNNDGLIDDADFVDLVIAGLDSQNVVVLLGNAQFGLDLQRPMRFNQISPTSSTPGFNSSLVLGHFNEDHVWDLAVTNSTDVLLTIAIGNGDGSFRETSTLALDTEVESMSIGDVNGDGRTDIIATQSLRQDTDPASLQVLIGRGDGTVQFGSAEVVGPTPLSLVSLDANSDGIPDLVTANLSDASFSVLLGRGDGTYRPEIRHETAKRPITVVTGDFNDDGRPDLALASRGNTLGPGPVSNGLVNIHLGRGDGTFRLTGQFQAGRLPTDMSTAQLNDDDGNGIIDERDREDIVVANLFSNQLTVLLATVGEELFHPVSRDSSPTVGDRPIHVAAADLNGDGFEDLVVTSGKGTEHDPGSQTISLLLGNGDGSFQAEKRIPQSNIKGIPQQCEIADVNHDGTLDLIAIIQTEEAMFSDNTESNNSIAEAAELVLSTGQQTTLSASITPSDDVDLFRIDLNSGQTMQVNVITSDGSNLRSFIRIFTANGTALGQTPSDTLGIEVSESGPIFIGVSAQTNPGYDPVNGIGTTSAASFAQGSYTIHISVDGSPILAPHGPGPTNSNVTDKVVQVFRGDGTGSFQPTDDSLSSAGDVDYLAHGQFNDDNRDNVVDNRDIPDLVLSRTSGVSLLLGAELLESAYVPTRNGISDLIVFDANGDGFADVATANGNSDNVLVLLGTGDGQLYFPEQLPTQPSVAEPIFADFNQDGTSDVIVVSQAGEILLRTGRATKNSNVPGTFDPPIILNPGAPATAIALAPSNTRPAIAAINRNAASISLYYFDSPGFPFNIDTASGATQLAAGDLNNDGLSDVVVAMAGTGIIQIFYGLPDGRVNISTVAELPMDGSPSVLKAPSDLLIDDIDGDGMLDLLVTDRTAATVSIYHNSGGGNFLHSGRFAVGSGLSVVQPANQELFQRVTRERTSYLTTGHFNNDNLLDVAFAHSGSNTVTIHLGATNGFTKHSTLAVGSDPIAIDVGMIDGDDQLDLVVLNEGSDDISLFLGRPHGLFVSAPQSASRPRYDAGNRPTGLSLQDVDQDGLVDLVLGNEFGDVMTLQQNPNANYETGEPLFKAFRRADRKVALAVDDINGDGISDWVVTNESADRLGIEFGQPDNAVASNADRVARFSEIGNRADGVVAPAAATTVQLNDDNQDGAIDDFDVLDLVVANSGANNILVYMGQKSSVGEGDKPGASRTPRGTGFFSSSAITLFAGTEPVDLTVGDVNLDSLPDLIVTNRGSNDVSVLLGDINEMLLPGVRLDVINPNSLTTKTAPVSSEIGMFDDDQIPDLLVAASGTDQALLIPGVGNGYFNESATVPFDTGSGSAPAGIVPLPTGGFVSINRGTNSLRQFNSFDAGASFSDIGVGLLPTAGLLSPFSNGMGFDLFIANSGDGTISILANGANGSLSLLDAFLSTELQNPTAMALANLGNGNDFALLVADEGDDLVNVFNRSEVGQRIPAEVLVKSSQNATVMTTVITVLAALVLDLPTAVETEMESTRKEDLDGSATQTVELIAGLIEAFSDVLAVGWTVLDATFDQLGELLQPGNSPAILRAVQNALERVLPLSPLDFLSCLDDIFSNTAEETPNESGTTEQTNDEDTDDRTSTQAPDDDRQAQQAEFERFLWRTPPTWWTEIDNLVAGTNCEPVFKVEESDASSHLLNEIADERITLTKEKERWQPSAQSTPREHADDEFTNDGIQIVSAAVMSLMSAGWDHWKDPSVGAQRNLQGKTHGSYH